MTEFLTAMTQSPIMEVKIAATFYLVLIKFHPEEIQVVNREALERIKTWNTIGYSQEAYRRFHTQLFDLVNA